MKTLQERLRYARENKGYSQMEVSRRAGINNKTLSGYENGVSEPDAVTLSKLAQLYGVTTDWLITGQTPDDLYKDIDQEVLEFVKSINPDKQQHFFRYLRGEVAEPVFETDLKKQFTQDVEQGMDIVELFERYPALTIAGATPTKEELEEIVRYFKALRIMKMM